MLTLEQTTLGHYRLLRRLCRGGMSDVYLARDEQGDRDVAIKVVHSHNGDLVERLQREVQAVRALTHERILPVLDYGEEGQWHYLVMPYMEHGNLRAKLEKGRISLEEVGMILEQIASALQFAHDHGILHRDIKPSNILLGDAKQVYLSDFGLAKTIDPQERDITQTGCLIGTPEYMAPELAEELFSKSCDIYALGVLLYQMVTGQLPFTGTTPLSIYWKHIQEQPVVPSLLNPAIPRPVEEVILCALEKDPDHRFSTALELAQAYMQAIHSTPTKPIAVRILPLARRGRGEPSVVGTAADTSAVGAINRPLRSFAAVVLVVFLLVSSLSLGFFVSQRGAQVKASQLLGTSAQLPRTDKTQQENPTPMLGVPPAAAVVEGAPVFEDDNDSLTPQRQMQGPPKKTKQNQGEKHKPKPKPKHHKGDTTSPTPLCGSVPTMVAIACKPNSNGVESDNPVIG